MPSRPRFSLAHPRSSSPPPALDPQDQQWKLGVVQSYDESRDSYAIEYNGGYKELQLVLIRYKPSANGIVQITKSYLLKFDPKDHGKQTDKRLQKAISYHPDFPIEKCGMCQMCENPQMKQSCQFMRNAQMAHKRVYAAMVALERRRVMICMHLYMHDMYSSGYLSLSLSLSLFRPSLSPDESFRFSTPYSAAPTLPHFPLDSRGLGKRIRVYWPSEKRYFLATITDFDPYLWRHQIMYDDGQVQELKLIGEQIRHAESYEMDYKDCAWYRADLMGVMPTLYGLFRSRPDGPAIVGCDVWMWVAGEEGEWIQGNVHAWDPERWRHKIKVTGVSGTTSAYQVGQIMDVDYTRMVLYVPDWDLGQELLERDDLRDTKCMNLAATGVRVNAWGGEPSTDRVTPGNPAPNLNSNATVIPAFHPHENPLMSAALGDVPHDRIMGWVQTYLETDTRVPAPLRALMKLHGDIRDKQMMEGQHGSSRRHGQTAMDLVGQHPLVAVGGLALGQVGDVEAVRKALVNGDGRLKAEWKGAQRMINAVFPVMKDEEEEEEEGIGGGEEKMEEEDEEDLSWKPYGEERG